MWSRLHARNQEVKWVFLAPIARTPSKNLNPREDAESKQFYILLLAAHTWLWGRCGRHTSTLVSYVMVFIFCVPMALMSRLTQSIHLCFGLPRFLLPGGTISRVFLSTYSWYHLLACSKPPQSCFPAPLCVVLYFTSLPDGIVSRMVSY